jgi:hypothetical protein
MTDNIKITDPREEWYPGGWVAGTDYPLKVNSRTVFGHYSATDYRYILPGERVVIHNTKEYGHNEPVTYLGRYGAFHYYVDSAGEEQAIPTRVVRSITACPVSMT